MVVVFLQSGSVTASVGLVGRDQCSECQNVQEFDVLLEYDYWEIAAAGLGLVTGRRYFAHFRTCGIGKLISTREVESTLDRVPIPFRRRSGLLSFFLIIAIVLAAIFAFRPGAPGLKLPR